MNGRDAVAGMAIDTGGGGGHRGGVTMLMLVKIQGVTFAARMAPLENVGGVGPVDRILQEWRRGMAIGAAILVNSQGVISDMASGNASRVIQDDAQAIRWNGGVILFEVRVRCRLVLMAVEAMDRILGRVGKIRNHELYGGANCNLGVDVPGCVMTGRANVAVGRQDIGPVQDRVAVGARPGIDLSQIGGDKGDFMFFAAAAGAVVMPGEV